MDLVSVALLPARIVRGSAAASTGRLPELNEHVETLGRAA